MRKKWVRNHYMNRYMIRTVGLMMIGFLIGVIIEILNSQLTVEKWLQTNFKGILISLACLMLAMMIIYLTIVTCELVSRRGVKNEEAET